MAAPTKKVETTTPNKSSTVEQNKNISVTSGDQKQTTLDRVTIQALQERVGGLEERLVKVEVTLETLSTGQSLMAQALENAGLMKEGEPVQPTSAWDPEKIKWIQVQGTRGPYERYPAKDQKAEATDDYKNMVADIKQHGGKMICDGYFMWLFQDSATVGRKLRKGKGPKPKPEKADVVESIKAKFPKDLEEMLEFEETEEFVIVRPRRYLGSENFVKIASVVRDAGGEYISAGKESHFRCPVRKG